MRESRRRVGVVSAPEMAPRGTPGKRWENAGNTPEESRETSIKRQGNVDVKVASFIVDVVFLFII